METENFKLWEKFKNFYLFKVKKSYSCSQIFMKQLYRKLILNISKGSSRMKISVLMFWGYAILYALRTNLSVAIVDMVNPTHKSNDR